MRLIIDRFEGKYAVCEQEDRAMINIEKYTLPLDATEGDVIIVENNEIIIDKKETTKRKKEIEELANDLWE